MPKTSTGLCSGKRPWPVGGLWDSTLYGGAFASDYYHAGALGVARDFAGLGALSLDATQARTDLGGLAGQVQGHSFAMRYGKSFQTGTNLRFAGYRYSTEGYRDFDEAVKDRNQSDRYLGNRRSRLEASIYQNFGKSSVSLTLFQDAGGIDRLAGACFGRRPGPSDGR